MSEQNEAIARNFIEGVWNRRDMSVVNQFVAPNHIPHGPFTEKFPQGAEGTETFVTGFLTAFSDLKATIVRQESEDDEVKTSLRFRGTHTGLLMDIPATGKQATVPVVVTDRIVNGKIVETWSDWNPEDMFRQLGVKQIAK